MPILMENGMHEAGSYIAQRATPEQIELIAAAQAERGSNATCEEKAAWVRGSLDLIEGTEWGKSSQTWCLVNRNDARDIVCSLRIQIRDATFISAATLPSTSSAPSTADLSASWSIPGRQIIRGRGAYVGDLFTRMDLRSKGYARILCKGLMDYLASAECQPEDNPDQKIIAAYGSTHVLSIFGFLGYKVLQQPNAGAKLSAGQTFIHESSHLPEAPLNSEGHLMMALNRHAIVMREQVHSEPDRTALVTPPSGADCELFLRAQAFHAKQEGVMLSENFGVEIGTFPSDSWGYAIWRPHCAEAGFKVVTYYASNQEILQQILEYALEQISKAKGVAPELKIWTKSQSDVQMMTDLGLEVEHFLNGKGKLVAKLIGVPEVTKEMTETMQWHHPPCSMYIQL